MNAVEIEEAITDLAERPFDRVEFPFQFLEAFGNKPATIKRLRDGHSNSSDLGGVLQRSNIHIAIAEKGNVTATLAALKASPATARAKAQFILATDGDMFEAENIESGETVACAYKDFPERFSFFLPLAGISTVKQVRDSAFDIRATSRLNRLYVELLKDNPEWSKADRRPDMNHFMARLIFCFFAEDTDIFHGAGLFTATVDQMSEKDASNTHEVIAEIFRAMNTPIKDRQASGVRTWANVFPYVNGGLFSGSLEVPRFSRIARSYLLHIGSLKWTQINPDIFGSMIQAVADDEERGALGMHYTSRPNILKVLNPLFLDSLRNQLEEAGDNARKLLNLRNRMARIRVFDPACGSGNFLVIAYKEMREIEAEINRRRGEEGRASDLPLTNFRGIELRDFPAEVARLALIIAEFQCDTLYRGQKLALAEFLPLNAENWITCGNALRLDWLSICPPTGTAVKLVGDDLFGTPLDQALIDFDNEGGETYICGNPPYKGSQTQTDEQKDDLKAVFDHKTSAWKSMDYVSGWLMKAAEYGLKTKTLSAFVTTNSICQGRQVDNLWPLVFATGHEIAFAHTSFKWANLASHNAGVMVAVVGIGIDAPTPRRLYYQADDGGVVVKETGHINAYLVSGPDVIVAQRSKPLSEIGNMDFGSMANDNGGLLFDIVDARQAVERHGVDPRYLREAWGAREFISGVPRSCLWLSSDEAREAAVNPWVADRLEITRAARAASPRPTTKKLAHTPYKFGEVRQTGNERVIIVPSVTSERREYLPCGYLDAGAIVIAPNLALYDAPLWNLALVASRLHLVWIATVCGKLKTDFRYSNTLGWNTFPVPALTDKNKSDLERCAENILLAREQNFPANIAEMYDSVNMPENLRLAHDQNDETLERVYIGRRFKNDTERLEKLLQLYASSSRLGNKRD